jgi:hypothetical protein
MRLITSLMLVLLAGTTHAGVLTGKVSNTNGEAMAGVLVRMTALEGGVLEILCLDPYFEPAAIESAQG